MRRQRVVLIFVLGMSGCGVIDALRFNADQCSRIPSISSSLEQFRGIAFSRVVPCRAVSEEEPASSKTASADNEGLQKDIQVLSALGFFPSNAKLGNYKQKQVSYARAFYDPKTQTVTLRGRSSRELLVHELTHALQDKQFKSFKSETSTTLDEKLSMQTLLEGDAQVTAAQFLKNNQCPQVIATSLGAELQQRVHWSDADNEPVSLQVARVLPYIVGERVVCGLFFGDRYATLDMYLQTRACRSADLLKAALENSPAMCRKTAEKSHQEHLGAFMLLAWLSQKVPIDNAIDLSRDLDDDEVITQLQTVTWNLKWNSKRARDRFLRLKSESPRFQIRAGKSDLDAEIVSQTRLPGYSPTS